MSPHMGENGAGSCPSRGGKGRAKLAQENCEFHEKSTRACAARPSRFGFWCWRRGRRRKSHGAFGSASVRLRVASRPTKSSRRSCRAVTDPGLHVVPRKRTPPGRHRIGENPRRRAGLGRIADGSGRESFYVQRGVCLQQRHISSLSPDTPLQFLKRFHRLPSTAGVVGGLRG
jgi:hypothetical protein